MLKNKKILISGLIYFIIIFSLGMLFSYYFNTSNNWGIFDFFDTPRVLADLSVRGGSHYRLVVHPLFVIFFQPIVKILNLFVKNYIIVIIGIQSLTATISLIVFNAIIKKITTNKNLVTILTSIFALSYPQIIFSTIIETYIYAQIFLLLLWLFAFYKIDKKFSVYDYIILLCLGIGCLGVTITNVVHYAIAVFILICFNDNVKQRFIKYILMMTSVLAFSVLLSNIQNIVWPDTPNFFISLIDGFFNKTTEELSYINLNVNFNNVMNVLNSNFAYFFNFFSFTTDEMGTNITFVNSIFSNIFSVICMILFMLINGYFIYKNFKNLKEHKLYFAMLMAYLFNFALHLFYGNDTAFLYICHYNYLILFIIAYVFNSLWKNIKISKWLTCTICSVFGISAFRVVSLLINKLMSNNYLTLEINIIHIIVILICITLILLLIFKNKWKILISMIIVVFLSIGVYKIGNYSIKNINYINQNWNYYNNQLKKYAVY